MAEDYKKSEGLTRQQKEAIAILSTGTVLEYFDLMLYIHMAVLLNELFFPQSDPAIAKLFAVFTFCSTFVLRPVGGLLIGWIGDHIGRKSTIVLTTGIMAASCVTMASIGTYEEIGLTATITVITCRALQGISSLGEVLGAMLYLTETLKRPYNYVATIILDIGTYLGGLLALIIASLAINIHYNWRIAFWFGAVIAVVGLYARIRLRETPDFVDFTRRMKIKAKLNKMNLEMLKDSPVYKEKVSKRTVLSYFSIRLLAPSTFYVSYIYISDFMKETLDMPPKAIISHNLYVTILAIFALFGTMLLIKKYHPILIAKIYGGIFAAGILFLPYLIETTKNLFVISSLQFFIIIPSFCSATMGPLFYKYVPMAKRFMILATTFGIAAAVSTITASFGLLYFKQFIGHYALLVIFIPLMIVYYLAIKYAEKLERKSGRYPNYPEENDPNLTDTASDEKLYGFDFVENEDDYKKYGADCIFSQLLFNAIEQKMEQENKKINLKFVIKAIIFAKKWHEGQLRTSGEPYHTHPLSVAIMVTEYYLKTDVIVAAILHDVVEDTDCSIELIEKEFNPRIAQIVERLTRAKYSDVDKGKLTLQNVTATLFEVNDNEAMLIKQLDRLHNLSSTDLKTKEKQIKIANETYNHLVVGVSYIADKLNIKNITLENKLLKYCSGILAANKKV